MSQVALVTGASRGIGKAIALRFAEDGFDVAVSDLSVNKEALEAVSKEIVAKGRASKAFYADISVEEQVIALIDDVVAQLGQINVLVANAGIAVYKPLIDHTADDWIRTFNVNTHGTFFSFKYAAKAMIAQGKGGRLIATSSDSGRHGWPGLGAYSASKAAMRGMMHVFASELGPHKITANVFCPGAVRTDIGAAIAIAGGMTPEIMTEQMAKMAPLGRIAETSDIVGVVSFLASKDAAFITGQSYSVNGGLMLE
ncbi:hypothetical protein NLJ89_g4354 [Agrocybe chaxingu]|uniref:Uncharacterized protein n=1 Tax=Agrocybe chaxingu TaxID=84603 RepID=A0A9W8MUM6_9AGAR|nr:hypothetical protein NLJ89_g4354 [Agrocybe chaxingu]